MDELETALRRQHDVLGQEQLDIQAERRILDQREVAIVQQRTELIEEIGKFVIARTEL